MAEEYLKGVDPITNPSHYQFSKACYEVRDVIRDRCKRLIIQESPDLSSKLVYDFSNAAKYILRCVDKNGLEDLKKAKYCIESMIEIIEQNEPCTKEQASTD